MTDREAMRLFVAAGNKAVQWHCVDENERAHYRKMAWDELRQRAKERFKKTLAILAEDD